MKNPGRTSRLKGRAHPLTGCARPFSKFFNVAASRPAKSPRRSLARYPKAASDARAQGGRTGPRHP